MIQVESLNLIPIELEFSIYAVPNLGFYSKNVIQQYGACWKAAGWGLGTYILDESILPCARVVVEAALWPPFTRVSC
jgi:hypothetical protein